LSEIVVTRLTPVFAARIDGVDITRELDERTWADILAAFEEHSGTTARFCTGPRRTTPCATSG